MMASGKVAMKAQVYSLFQSSLWILGAAFLSLLIQARYEPDQEDEVEIQFVNLEQR